MLKDFREFLARTNALGLALAVVIGTAASQVVQSLVGDIITPVLGKLTGHIDFSHFYIPISPLHHATYEEAKRAGDAISIGVFANTLINFTIVAFVVFLVQRAAQKRPEVKDCPECLEKIPLKARRCRACAQPVA
jgi:large conductance mechanosensitive channel